MNDFVCKDWCTLFIKDEEDIASDNNIQPKEINVTVNVNNNDKFTILKIAKKLLRSGVDLDIVMESTGLTREDIDILL